MSNLREAAQQALEAYEKSQRWPFGVRPDREFAALRDALAEPEQEPVAWIFVDDTGMKFVSVDRPHRDYQPLYTAPPQRKPLTEEQCVSIFREAFLASPDPLVKDNMTIAFARAIERAHGIGGSDE